MLLLFRDEIIIGTLIVICMVWVATAYAYRKNLRREEGDPDKKAYHPRSVWITPFTFVVFSPLAIFFFIVRALVFALAVFVFAVLLIAFRKPFLFVLWDKFAMKVGEPLLKLNTRLIQLSIGR